MARDRPIVLETTVLRGGTLADIAALHARGHRVRISETALEEVWVHTANKYREGEFSRAEARGKFFKRLRLLVPYVDASDPIAPTGEHGIRCAAGTASSADDAERMRA
jgi:hypothetical protein